MDRIKNIPGEAKLTPKDKIVLDYILRNRAKACFMTSSEIAQILGISPSSVVRVSSKLALKISATLRGLFRKSLRTAGKRRRHRFL